MKISMKPETQQFKLAYDKSGESIVTIKQARTGDVVKIASLFSAQTRTWDDAEVGQVKITQKWNLQELKRERAYLTVVGLDIEDDDGKPVFKFKDVDGHPALKMSRHEFIRSWDLLPSKLTDEIHDFIVEVNPQWHPDSESD